MIRYGRGVPFTCFSVVSLVVTSAAQAGVYSMKAVEVNGHPIPPTDTVAVCPGDRIMAEIYLSEWSPADQGLETWQAQLAPEGIVSGSAGFLLPLGWDAALDAPECTTDDDCAEGLHCETRICVGPDHDPDIGAYIDPTRPDYIYAGVSAIYAVDPTSLVRGYRYGATLINVAVLATCATGVRCRGMKRPHTLRVSRAERRAACCAQRPAHRCLRP